MRFSRRWVILVLFLLSLLLVGFLFWPLILNEIIVPVSIVVWLLLRLLVLSIDQKYYWGALIFGAVFFLSRFLPQYLAAPPVEAVQNVNAILRNLGFWRSLFTIIDPNIWDEKALKRELIRLLVALSASQQRTTANFELYEDLQQGRLPLPEHIHTYLFGEEPQETQRSLKGHLQAFGRRFQKWLRRLRGEEAAEHNRMINEVLCFMETALEIKHDHGKIDPH